MEVSWYIFAWRMFWFIPMLICLFALLLFTYIGCGRRVGKVILMEMLQDILNNE